MKKFRLIILTYFVLLAVLGSAQELNKSSNSIKRISPEQATETKTIRFDKEKNHSEKKILTETKTEKEGQLFVESKKSGASKFSRSYKDSKSTEEIKTQERSSYAVRTMNEISVPEKILPVKNSDSNKTLLEVKYPQTLIETKYSTKNVEYQKSKTHKQRDTSAPVSSETILRHDLDKVNPKKSKEISNKNLPSTQILIKGN